MGLLVPVELSEQSLSCNLLAAAIKATDVRRGQCAVPRKVIRVKPLPELLFERIHSSCFTFWGMSWAVIMVSLGAFL